MLHVLYMFYTCFILFFKNRILPTSIFFGVAILKKLQQKQHMDHEMTNYSQLVCGWMMAGSGSTRLRFGGPNDPYDSHTGNDSSTFDLNNNRVKPVISTVLILIEMNALIFVDPSRSGGGVDIEGMRWGCDFFQLGWSVGVLIMQQLRR